MRLFVAIPSHSGTVVAETAFTMAAAQEIASRRGWSVEFHCFYGAVIADIRNAIAASFMRSSADLLLMLDSDQSIARNELERMLDFDHPVVGCIYPRRKFHWSNVNMQTAANIDQAVYQALEFVGELEFDVNGQAQVVNGFAKALFVGTGILILKREVFERLIVQYPELKNRGFDRAAYPHLAEHNWGFFNHIHPESISPLSEDVSFCHRWREAGEEIWADVTSTTIHMGQYAFRGNYLDFLRARGEIIQ